MTDILAKLADALEALMNCITETRGPNADAALQDGKAALAAFKAQPSGEWVMPEPAGVAEIDCGPAPGGGRELMYVDGFTAAQVQAAHSAGLAARIPAGFWLAPDEPTPAMLIEVDEEVGGHCHSCTRWKANDDDCKRVYVAMRQAHITATEAPAKGGE